MKILLEASAELRQLEILSEALKRENYETLQIEPNLGLITVVDPATHRRLQLYVNVLD